MSHSGIGIPKECITVFQDLKLNKKYKFIIYKLSDDFTSVEIEECSEDKDWENFRQKLIKAQTKSKNGAIGKGPRFAVYDFNYELLSGEGYRYLNICAIIEKLPNDNRSKIVFISWSPDDAGVQAKMIYASSKDGLRRNLDGIACEFQANDEDDIEYVSVLKNVSKGLA
ncbi:hypothetical protein EPUL_002848 [Erysiphe pulchra]|uniref:Cofilin n=1 Tax=Erysiphe pulchra TaxID=225359 RepID=A0A2S4PT50_9PEZI|nr:hypothetical protein EPUL_002848 [Erysiphe pulchra]